MIKWLACHPGMPAASLPCHNSRPLAAEGRAAAGVMATVGGVRRAFARLLFGTHFQAQAEWRD
jgi:hypothetical protein